MIDESITVRVPKDIKAEIWRRAASMRMTPSSLIVNLLTSAVADDSGFWSMLLDKRSMREIAQERQLANLALELDGLRDLFPRGEPQPPADRIIALHERLRAGKISPDDFRAVFVSWKEFYSDPLKSAEAKQSDETPARKRAIRKDKGNDG
jgi:hypothetical protein